METEDTYKTIAGMSEGLYKEKGSKFLAFAYPVDSGEAIKAIQETVRTKYHDARHRCFAYVLGPKKDNYMLSDDGEPANTAGQPILGQIRSKDLTNVLVYVVRYFGGILLGKGGLVKAYKTAAGDALDKASIITKTMEDVFEIRFSYADMSEVMHRINSRNLAQFKHAFEQDCSLQIKIRQKQSAAVKTWFRDLPGVTIHYLYSGGIKENEHNK